MNSLTSLVWGLAGMLAGWLIARAVAGARLRRLYALGLDLLMPATVFIVLLAITARPIFAGVTTFALAVGFAGADRAKRSKLAEPILFTDVFQAFDIFRHPRLALPFPHIGRILIGVGLVVSVFAGFFVWEPEAWTLTPWPALAVVGTGVLVARLLSRPPTGRVAQMLRRLEPVADPLLDSAMFGPFATLLIHGLIARGERKSRRVRAAPPAQPAEQPEDQSGITGLHVPVVVIQCESFFDARRLHPGIDQDLLPVYDDCCRASLQWGRLTVPCWGANTSRTEFAVLTGLSEDDLGFDRCNPYHRFARAPITSLAWHFRAQGYRTICVHPFDRTFYGRDLIMPHLGFDEFIGEEAFVNATRIDGFVADAEVATFVADLLRRSQPNLFVFVITMENHGPWVNDRALTADGTPVLSSRFPALPKTDASALHGYLAGLKSADEMLTILRPALEGNDGVLAFYGDHQPSFSRTFTRLGFDDRRSDYVIWRSQRGAGKRVDIVAHEIYGTVIEAAGLSR